MNQDEVKSLLKKYGRNTISFQSLIGSFSYFSIPEIEGCIVYTKAKRTILVIWDPLVSDEDFFELVQRFRTFFRSKRYNCAFLSITKECKKRLEIMDFWSIKIGEEAIFDLKEYSFEGSSMKSNRNYITRAKKEWVTIEKLKTANKEIYKILSEVSENWLKSKKVKGLSFLLKLDPLLHFEDKIIFVAKVGEKIVAYLSCVPIYQRNGFYFEDLVRSKEAPIGTNQFLIYEATQHLKELWFSIASFGTSPLANSWVEETKENKVIRKIFDFLYKNVKGFYNFKGLHDFKKSMYPNFWEAKYIAFYPRKVNVRIFLSIVKAYNPNGVSGLILSRVGKIITHSLAKRKKI